MQNPLEKAEKVLLNALQGENPDTDGLHVAADALYEAGKSEVADFIEVLNYDS